jgi:hypothetical protein
MSLSQNKGAATLLYPSRPHPSYGGFIACPLPEKLYRNELTAEFSLLRQSKTDPGFRPLRKMACIARM